MSILNGFENITEENEVNLKDTIEIKYILCTLDEPNLNGAIITYGEAKKSYQTIVGKPLVIVPDWLDSPTGHDEQFPALSEKGKIIGTHTKSEIQLINGKNHIVVTAQMYSLQHPDIAKVMLGLHFADNLKFSYELSYLNSKETTNGRELHDITFTASCCVSEPANPHSVSLEVAQDLTSYNPDNPLAGFELF